ncbi:MAG TPA: thioredoxin [Kiritimatiellia bacterium]|nr:thioredoxin [Kiritimatiellia bacterium]HOM59548.1 thioredoxin [Kiritimatiellia bacterium]HOR96802.1 thioredoxin [Kiritimatiellia bacterium]HPC49797.1 thioredoxin [Kiritimatiellia bacterium]HPK38155.1 thioredoxin [Kiritimatiellia bacterium]
MRMRIFATVSVIGCLWLTGCKPAGAPTTDSVPDAGSGTAAQVLELNDMTFTAQTAQGVVLVDFWAPWCGPCRTQGPIIEQAAKLLGDSAKVAKVNVDDAQQTAKRFGVQGIPTLIVFKDGKPGKRFVGVTQAAVLVEAVKEAL